MGVMTPATDLVDAVATLVGELQSRITYDVVGQFQF